MKGNNNRVIEITNIEDSMRELSKIASNGRIAPKAGEDFVVRAVKLKGIDSREANIFKCEAYACGMSCYIPEDVILFNSAKSDVLVSGTIDQYAKLCYRLKKHILNLQLPSEHISDVNLSTDIFFINVLTKILTYELFSAGTINSEDIFPSLSDMLFSSIHFEISIITVRFC